MTEFEFMSELSLEVHSILDCAEFLYLMEKVEHALNLLALIGCFIEAVSELNGCAS